MKRVSEKTARRKATSIPLADALPPVPMTHTDVRQRAMLVNLTVHQWLGNATDERITDDVARQHNIDPAMGRYQKCLFSKAALENMRSTANKLRSVHNKYTLPWDEWGTRILSAQAFMQYNAEIRNLIGQYEQLFRDEFEAIGTTGIVRYEEKKREAKTLLNGAYREADYPTISQLKRKFGAKVTIMPIPAAEDFRLDLGAEATAQVRREIESRSTNQVEEAMKTLFERMQSVVSRLVQSLKDEQTVPVRKGLFTAIEAVLDSLPMLNITGDVRLELFATEIRTVIAGLDAKELREGPALRAAVLERADAILSQMNDFFGE